VAEHLLDDIETHSRLGHVAGGAMPEIVQTETRQSRLGPYDLPSFINSRISFVRLAVYKIIMPLSIATLAMLGVPLGFTHHRPSIARQLTFGACIGILYFLLNEISASIGLLSGFRVPDRGSVNPPPLGGG